MRNRAIICSLLLAIVAFPAHSQSMAESEGEFSATASLVSAYMFRGMKLGGLSFQPEIEYSKGPLSMGVWINVPLEKLKNSDLGHDPVNPEIDFMASHTFTVVPSLFTIKPGINVYTFPRAKQRYGIHKTQFEPYVSFGCSIKDLALSLNYYYDLTMQGPTYELGAEYAIPIEQLKCEIELAALVGRFNWSDCEAKASPKTGNSGDYFRLGAAVPIEFSKKAKLVAGWYFEKGTNNYFKTGGLPKESNPDAVGRGVFSVAFSCSF